MASKREREPSEPSVGQVIATTAAPIDITKPARERAPSPTDRIEARADLSISELKADKARLLAELEALRRIEMAHLREDTRWLEDRESRLLNAYTSLRTSYEWAIAFNWFSFALIAVGGSVVSYASFLPAPKKPDEVGLQKIVATFALALLLVGVILQAIVSYRGMRTLVGLGEAMPSPRRPGPNPTSQEA